MSDKARKRAVEAAAKTWWADGYENNPHFNADMVAGMEEVIAAYLATMADAGWRMVRDVEEKACAFGLAHDPYADGWNDCRAAMLSDDKA